MSKTFLPKKKKMKDKSSEKNVQHTEKRKKNLTKLVCGV